MNLDTAIKNGYRIAYWHEKRRHIVMIYKTDAIDNKTYVTYAASINTPPGIFIKKQERTYALGRLTHAPLLVPIEMPLDTFLTLPWAERKLLLRNLLRQYGTYNTANFSSDLKVETVPERKAFPLFDSIWKTLNEYFHG